jgi:anti-sigma regulatory factor (Ser/Thr protein kinase)
MLDGEAQGDFREVCGLHSEVVRGAPMPPSAELSRRFVASPGAAREARRFVSSQVHSWDLDVLHDDTVIAAGELVANAISYGGGDFTVGLTRSTQGLRLGVGDPSAVAVAPNAAPRLAEGGRGLAIVAAVANDWGYDLVGGGKVVWAEFHHPMRPGA